MGWGHSGLDAMRLADAQIGRPYSGWGTWIENPSSGKMITVGTPGLGVRHPDGKSSGWENR
jgi:hypothetical protein